LHSARHETVLLSLARAEVISFWIVALRHLLAPALIAMMMWMHSVLVAKVAQVTHA
jgi:hypothetical protein